MALYRVPIGLTWSGPGSPGANIFTIRTTSTVIDQVNAALAALQTFYTTLAPHMGGNLVAKAPDLISTIVSDEERAGGTQPEYVQVANPWSVTSTSAYLAPAPVAITCTWYTSVATRRGRGRTFISPLSSMAAESNGTPTTAVIDAIRGAAQALVDESTSNLNGWALAVYSEADNLARDVVRTQVRDKFAVLRSRRD